LKPRSPLGGFVHLCSVVRIWHEEEAEGGAKPVRLCPCSSDVNLFSYGEGVIDFNAEYLTGLSIFVCPDRSWTARKLPVRQ